MNSNAEVRIVIQVTVAVHIWQGTDVDENVQRDCDVSDVISLRRVMPINDQVDIASLVASHLPLMAVSCSDALTSRVNSRL